MHKLLAAAYAAAALSVGATTVMAAQTGAPTSTLNQSGTPSPAATERATTPPAGSAQTPGSTTVSDDQLQRFVASAQQIAALTDKYSAQYQSAADDAAKRRIVDEANQRMTEAVQANGLTVQEFNRIGDAVENDPALAQRARQMLR